MKTSLICLLLLAAVACAAPQAGEMPGEKRVGMAWKMREMMAEKRKENLVADAKFDVEAESRSESCSGPCHEVDGNYLGCYYDACDYENDEYPTDGSTDCFCCWSNRAPDNCP